MRPDRIPSLAVLLLLVSVPSSLLARTSGSGPQPQIQVPILWCAVQGTDLASASQAERNADLWRLHELPSDWVFIPQANVTLRSELVWDLKEQANFKVVLDPDPAGTLGNIASAVELAKAAADCRKQYERDRNVNAVALQGISALYVRRLLYLRSQFGIDAEDATVFVGDAGAGAFTGGDSCDDPPKFTGVVGAFLAIEETIRDEAKSSDPMTVNLAVTTLAHEFGHALSLNHGNGTNDNSDPALDDNIGGSCDPGEATQAFICKTPATIMNSSGQGCTHPNRTTFITGGQATRVRIAADAVPGNVDPPGPLIPGPVTSDFRGDPRGDVAQAWVDFEGLHVAHNSRAQTTHFVHQLSGLTGRRDGLSYVVFIDLDGDATTGGAPSDLSFDTGFQGAELVAEIEFRSIKGVILLPHVWKFQSGSFLLVDDDRISASLQSSVDAETGVATFDFVEISIPDEVVGPLPTPLQLQAMAQDPSVPVIDRLPQGELDFVNFWLIPARYPECEVSPESVPQKRQTTVTATFPLENSPVHVVLGADPIALGTTDPSGTAVVPFRIPADAPLGPRLVTVGVGETALTADCSVTVEAALPNAPPDCSAAVASPTRIWPPNQKFQAVSINGVTDTDPEGDPVSVIITSIQQDEPTGKGRGLPAACPDGAGVGTASALVRAERIGTPASPGDGRVYQIGFEATDDQGAACRGSVTVCVPHDASNPRSCVDQGAQFNSATCN